MQQSVSLMFLPYFGVFSGLLLYLFFMIRKQIIVNG